MTRLNFLCDPELQEDLDYIAQASGLNRSEALREAVFLYISSPAYKVSTETFNALQAVLTQHEA
jgi:metal-responsive CopG/Arc/MetJ family transcriptional regulator